MGATYGGITPEVSCCTTKACNDVIAARSDQQAQRYGILNAGLLQAARNGDSAALKRAIDSKANLETRRPMLMARAGNDDEILFDSPITGMTPLMFAAQAGSVPCVQILIQAKANPNAGEEDGATALHFAASEGCFDVAHTLIAAGARREALDNDDMGVLDYLARSDCVVDVEAWQELMRTPGLPGPINKRKHKARTCPAGHKLHLKPGRDTACSGPCKREVIKSPEKVYRCDFCDYGLCEGCYFLPGDSLPSMQAPSAASRARDGDLDSTILAFDPTAGADPGSAPASRHAVQTRTNSRLLSGPTSLSDQSSTAKATDCQRHDESTSTAPGSIMSGSSSDKPDRSNRQSNGVHAETVVGGSASQPEVDLIDMAGPA